MFTFGRKFFVYALMLLLVIVSAALFAGCGGKKYSKETAAPTSNGDSSKQQEKQKKEPRKTKKSKGKAAKIGKKGSNKTVRGMKIAKITATQDLTSKEATALLQRGEPGESPENATAPAKGNELLLITLSFNGKKAQTVITPADLTLKDKEGKEFTETSTNGQGGIFNMKPVEAGKNAKITAVYEVPEGKTGLVLIFKPFGDKAIKLKVR